MRKLLHQVVLAVVAIWALSMMQSHAGASAGQQTAAASEATRLAWALR